MTRPTTYLLFVFLTYATQGFAQSPPRPTATVTADAPVFATANASQAPLRVASAGSVLLLIKQEGEWCNIEFQDPQYGRRPGYIETKYVRLSGTAPVDLSTPVVAGQEPVVSQSAQQPLAHAQGKSRSQGFFIGVAYEGNGVIFEDDSSGSGPGFGVTFGYGFSPRLALYGQWSGASIDDGLVSYGLGHFDIGTRVHFRAPANTVVPFFQVGLSARALRLDVGADTGTASGYGLAFGGGINAHFKPVVAFTAGVAWSAGNIGDYKVNGASIPLESSAMTTARVHLGIIWFVQSK
jgi:hypothetical protein